MLDITTNKTKQSRNKIYSNNHKKFKLKKWKLRKFIYWWHVGFVFSTISHRVIFITLLYFFKILQKDDFANIWITLNSPVFEYTKYICSSKQKELINDRKKYKLSFDSSFIWKQVPLLPRKINIFHLIRKFTI